MRRRCSYVNPHWILQCVREICATSPTPIRYVWQLLLELSSTGANGGDYPQPTATRGDEAKYYKVDCILTNYRIVSSWRELSIRLLIGWLWCVEFVAYVTHHSLRVRVLTRGLVDMPPLTSLVILVCPPNSGPQDIGSFRSISNTFINQIRNTSRDKRRYDYISIEQLRIIDVNDHGSPCRWWRSHCNYSYSKCKWTHIPHVFCTLLHIIILS